jgi:ribosomal 50S subunit-associated protein YjgA (DUF615 family)
MSEVVQLHNTHLVFIRSLGRDSGESTRRHIRQIENIAKQMKKQGIKVYRENLINVKAEKKAEKARIKAIPKKRGRPPKGR